MPIFHKNKNFFDEALKEGLFSFNYIINQFAYAKSYAAIVHEFFKILYSWYNKNIIGK